MLATFIEFLLSKETLLCIEGPNFIILTNVNPFPQWKA